MKAELDHIGIAVQDIGATLAFYRDVLQLDFVESEEVHAQRVRAHFLTAGGARLELLEATAPDSPVARFLEKRGPGLHHLAFRVPDVSAMLDQLRALGVKLIDQQPRRGAEGSLVAFLHPSSTFGVLIELKQEAAADQRAE